MRFGTFHLIGAPEMQPAEQRIGETIEQMVLADELGLDKVWVAEHHFSNYGYATNPLLLIARAAGVARRIRFGQAIIVTPFWHPLRLAEDIALTDILTDGRLDIGLGRGYQKMETDAFELKLEESRALFLEQLEIMKKAWTEDDFTFQGQFFNVPRPITMLPKPIQKPHPQIWVACQSEQTIDWTADQGYYPIFSGSSGGTQISGWPRQPEPPDRRPAVRLRLRRRGGGPGRALADSLAAPPGEPSSERQRTDRRGTERGVPGAERADRRGAMGPGGVRSAGAVHRPASPRRPDGVHRLHRLVRCRWPAGQDRGALDAALRHRGDAGPRRAPCRGGRERQHGGLTVNTAQLHDHAIPHSYMTMGEHDRAVEACNRALALAEQVEDSALLV
jgi:alkanesulfonate monooxygenase SsuD/methylene tetrahydromethanopterin reductase-like flavin-dependent oxidoreductase (luciferase family)